MVGKMKHKEIGCHSKGMHSAYSSEAVVVVPDAAVSLAVASAEAKAMEDWHGIVVQPCLPTRLKALTVVQKIEACQEVVVV